MTYMYMCVRLDFNVLNSFLLSLPSFSYLGRSGFFTIQWPGYLYVYLILYRATYLSGAMFDIRCLVIPIEKEKRTEAERDKNRSSTLISDFDKRQLRSIESLFSVLRKNLREFLRTARRKVKSHLFSWDLLVGRLIDTVRWMSSVL